MHNCSSAFRLAYAILENRTAKQLSANYFWIGPIHCSLFACKNRWMNKWIIDKFGKNGIRKTRAVSIAYFARIPHSQSIPHRPAFIEIREHAIRGQHILDSPSARHYWNYVSMQNHFTACIFQLVLSVSPHTSTHIDMPINRVRV